MIKITQINKLFRGSDHRHTLNIEISGIEPDKITEIREQFDKFCRAYFRDHDKKVEYFDHDID
jgi:hypothetical protein